MDNEEEAEQNCGAGKQASRADRSVSGKRADAFDIFWGEIFNREIIMLVLRGSSAMDSLSSPGRWRRWMLSVSYNAA